MRLDRNQDTCDGQYMDFWGEEDGPAIESAPAQECTIEELVEAPTESEPSMLQQFPDALPAAATTTHDSTLQSALSRPLQNEGICCNNCSLAVPLRQLLGPTLRLTRKHPPHRPRIHCKVSCQTILLVLFLAHKHNPVHFGRTMHPIIRV